MNEKEYYSLIGNWDFSKIKYTVERKTNFEYFSKIKEYSNDNSLCLDIGTGGGEKLLKQYPKVGYLIGTDFSLEMIKTANVNLSKTENIKNNISFIVMDNFRMNFKKNIFDIVSARHTAINTDEIYRILKNKGYLIIEGVDKMDCIELKNVFKRGQAYKDKISISEIDYNNLIKSGFKIIENVKIYEDEYYNTKEDLLALLKITPILDDYSEMEDNEKCLYPNKNIEKNLFDEYVKKFMTDKGILLKRVSYGIIAQKQI